MAKDAAGISDATTLKIQPHFRHGRRGGNEQAPPFSSSTLSGLRKIESLDLFEGARSIVIMHAGERYQLRVTRANRLILTK